MTFDFKAQKAARKQEVKAAGSERIPPIAGALFTVILVLAAATALGLDRLGVSDTVDRRGGHRLDRSSAASS